MLSTLSCPSAHNGAHMLNWRKASVSVVITAYNHARFIAETIDSALSQNIDPLEIIVVDDESADETLSIAQSYSDRGVIAFTKPNGGPSSALNAGIARAKGDIIAIISADDVLLPDSIEMRCEALALTGADIVSANPVWIDGAGRKLHANEYPPVFQSPEGLSSLEIFKKLFFNGNFICAPSIAITRRCLDAVGPFNEILWQLQDYEYWLRASAQGFKFIFCQQPLVQYRMHTNNLSTLYPERLMQETSLVLAHAATMLSVPDLQELLFGPGLRNEDFGLDAFSLSRLLLLSKKDSSIHQFATIDLSKVLDDTLAYKRFANCFKSAL